MVIAGNGASPIVGNDGGDADVSYYQQWGKPGLPHCLPAAFVIANEVKQSGIVDKSTPSGLFASSQ
jgi:hypothetical protein